ELAGGPGNGHRHLVGSNIDWGQDLLYLRDWVTAHPEARPFALAYHNCIDARVCGAAFPPVPPGPPPGAGPDVRRAEQYGPSPGYFALDLHSLQGSVYKYFERFQPVGKAGYSIFIYHITLEQANRARREMGLAPLAG